MRFRKERQLDWMKLDSALKKVVPDLSRPKISRHFLMHWMSVKLPDNFQIREHSWPCRFHINITNDNLIDLAITSIQTTIKQYLTFHFFKYWFIKCLLCVTFSHFLSSYIMVTGFFFGGGSRNSRIKPPGALKLQV